MYFLIGLAVGLALYGAYLFSKSFFQVDQGHLGVVTRFGRALHADDAKRLRTYPPGLHRKGPWDRVIQVPVMEQNLDLSGEEGGRMAMAADGTVLRLDSILRYVPVKEELGHFLFGLRSPMEHITGLFTCLLRNEIANFEEKTPAGRATGEEIGSYALIRKERHALNARIEQFCQSEIGSRYGVQFNAVDLTDILPPDELAQALNAVIQARSEAEGLYARAEADAQQRIFAAEQGIEIAKLRANAVETEIEVAGRFLGDLADRRSLQNYVSRRRAEVINEARAVYRKD